MSGSFLLSGFPKTPSRILVADDERHISRLIGVNLERAGNVVRCAGDGREAIDLLERETFDAAILDLMMPYADGYAVLTYIREREETRSMWVALMTANADEWRARTDLPYRPNAYWDKSDPAHRFR